MQKIDKKQLKLYIENNILDLMNLVVESILSRRSVRKYTNKEISKDILSVILKCGYYAPSGHNMQTWRFMVVSNKNDISKLRKVT